MSDVVTLIGLLVIGLSMLFRLSSVTMMVEFSVWGTLFND